MKTYTSEGSDVIRECIGRAVFAVMAEKSFDSISVSEICGAASVGRTTYYRYYGSRTGKRDALLFFLVSELGRAFAGGGTQKDRDVIFLEYLYASKERLRLLRRDGLTDVIDSLVFEVFGPASGEDKVGFYTKYAGAGLWVGLVRSILANDFCDDAQTVRRCIALGVAGLSGGGA